ncbi:MAG: 4Fe-4S dicluster domain-containing protein [Methanobacteriota archaeon]|nr:MAG: 4Fe-4S dicluster domain-containing protein [Euryarchaeota archaeon]
MPKMLVPYPDKCTGCRFCEMACSLFHEGKINHADARLQVHKGDVKTDFPVVCTNCVACGEECCVNACPTEAISVVDGIVKVDEDECTACGECVEACPFGVMRMEETAFKCDLCGGDPTCVKFCPMGAIKYEEPNEAQYNVVKKLLEGV